ncbi:MAG TPA: 5-(carboxyamino)imidazole ribonucleotide mutase [Terriglobales bacterium]|nr:5-(carboxyamino)imidazole ribonucleotide mutase [Terriglobales bacterium]
MKKVLVVMGSDSDLPVVEGAIAQLTAFDIPFEAHVCSAHRTPDYAAELARNAAQKGFGVILAFAGKAAHLAGVLAAYTVLPVIAVPVSARALDGIDALLSMVQMPPGVPVATVAIDGGKNAGVLAAQILATGDAALFDKLETMKADMAASVLKKDEELQGRLK